MPPKVILNNSITLNGALAGFLFDLDLHYGEAASFGAQGYMVGSGTVLSIDDVPVSDELRAAEPKDPEAATQLPWWVVVDSKGQLQSRLHYFRQMPYIRDILVLVSEKTPQEYLKFLEAHRYGFLKAGADHVDLAQALRMLEAEYGIDTLLLDTGSTLSSVLLAQGLVDEVNLMIYPMLTADTDNRIFHGLELGGTMNLEVLDAGEMEHGVVRVRYGVVKG